MTTESRQLVSTMVEPTGVAETARTIQGFLYTLAWFVIIAGAAVTGVGVWALGIYFNAGWGSWILAAIWALGCIFGTAILWSFVVLGGLIAEYIENRTLDQQERVLS